MICGGNVAEVVFSIGYRSEGRKTTMKKIVNKLSGLKFEPSEEPYIGVKANGSIILGDCGTGAPGRVSVLNKADSKIENNTLDSVILGDCEIITRWFP